VLLLLTGELSAWSVDERWRMRADPELAWRRGVAVAALALCGLVASTLLVALSAVPPSHGLLWTVAGAAAAVSAAGTGIWAARR
jgi:predicted membrane-bound spermidine synthase